MMIWKNSSEDIGKVAIKTEHVKKDANLKEDRIGRGIGWL